MANRRRTNWELPALLFLATGLALALSLSGGPAAAQAMARMPTQPSMCLGEDDQLTTQPAQGREAVWAVRPSTLITYYVYVPLVDKAETCPPIPGESYGALSVNPPPTDRPAEAHADLNLALRGYAATDATKGLVDYGGGDPGAPQLPGLFADNRTGTFSHVYQVYDWDWACNCRGDLLTNWPVTLAGLATTPGEAIRVPNSGYSIGGGYEVLVLYASTQRITLKYTRDDNVISGYTLHVENVCVEPNLLALYHAWNSTGRGHLPALRAGQAFGSAREAELGVAIRDNGAFMDPRSRDDWWRGR